MKCHCSYCRTEQKLKQRYNRNLNRRNPDPFKSLEIYQPQRKIITRCLICEKPTKKGKPFCTDHIEKSKYVKLLRATHEKMQEELNNVRKYGMKALLLNSYYVKFALKVLNIEDGLLLKEFGEETGIPEELIYYYTKFMQKHYLVDVVGKNKRIFLSDPVRKSDPVRNLIRQKIIGQLQIDPATLRKWVRQGAPHDTVKRKTGGYPIYLFNLAEIIKWRGELLKTSARISVSRRRQRLKGAYMPIKKKRPITFWDVVMDDLHAGMPVKNVAKKHGIGVKLIHMHMKEQGVSKKPHRIPLDKIKPLIVELQRISGLSLKTLEEKHTFTPKILGVYRTPGKRQIKTVSKDIYDKLIQAIESYF